MDVTLKMTSKNLMHIFMIMRDKAIQRRNVYQRNENCGIQDSLIEEMEMGYNGIACHNLPPWSSYVEEIQFNIEVLEGKTKKLSALQDKLIRCPSLDDNTEEEKQLTLLANEIKLSLERCQKLMLQMKNYNSRGREQILNRNVSRALANRLQDAKNTYTSACSHYASTMNNFKKTSSFFGDTMLAELDSESHGKVTEQSQSWSQDQLLFLNDNTFMAEEREKAVQHVFKSTLDLNQLFRDVAQLIHEQGTIVDRIDYNVEQTLCRVEQGAAQLKKAEYHQRKNRKLFCVFVLAGGIIFFVLLLIIFKS